MKAYIQKKLERDKRIANHLKNKILEGYNDMVNGRFIEFTGDLFSDLKTFN